ncbi:MAG: HAD-IC family P-type ATPase [Candidatus Nanopelagicales bacterium]
MATAEKVASAGPTATTRWYALSPDEVVSRLGTDVDHGLTTAGAADVLARTGPNALPEEKPKPGWLRFLDEYRSFMQVILVIAAVVSALIQEWSTALLLLVLTVLNAVVGLREEGKAESAMNALKSMMKSTARVRRDGTEAAIPADQLVVGDLVLLSAGDQVPADGRLVAASALQIDESALTGESVPAGKDATTLPDAEVGPGDQSNMAFMNTPVTHGSGVMVVTATGAGTEVGRISGLLSATKSEQTPLQQQLTRMTQWIALAALVTMVVMFAVGLQRGEDPKTLFVIAIALAIAAIPEALPTVVQVILSLGAVGLAKRDAIVKDLSSVETLGSTSAINSDKTGTLTMNQMTAVEIVDLADRYTVTGIGYGLEGAITHAAGTTPSIDDAILPYVIASDAKLVDGTVVGDPTEGALLVLAHKAALDIDGTREKLPRIATLPFDPTYKIMAAFTRTTDADGRDVVRAFVKGAGPAMLDRAGSAVAGSVVQPWSDELRRKADEHVVRMEGEGLRVMAAGRKDLDPAGFDPSGDLLSCLDGLTITSLVGMIDPPRDSSKKAVADAQAAHIRVRMVTGDDVTTGAAIAEQLGIPGEAILGADFAALSEAERLERIEGIGVVGRVAPEHKVLLVETLRAKGEVVAMTGDGVNDAPAIKAADIGIAMGSGTEVAKNAGRMILTNDDFATIVFAVEQGRTLYDNLMKYVRFILITLVAFVLMFLGATIFNIAAGEPFTPGQILWINFLIDMPLGIALGFDLETPGLMNRPPRPRKETILHASTLVSSLLVGLYMAVVCLYLLDHGETVDKSLAMGTTMALWAFLWFRIVCTLESRSLTGSIFRRETFDCRQINVVILIEIVLGFLVADSHVLNKWLATTSVGFEQWFLAFVPAIVLLVLWEIGKAVSRKAGVAER